MHENSNDMQELLKAVRGKVFIHPVARTDYGPIRFPSAPEKFETLDGRSFEVLAEDHGGNYCTVTENGAVWFWEHETDELEQLTRSVAEFVAHCADPRPVELDPKKVKSVWIDPAFAKSIGMKAPKDGWVKKRSEPK